MISILLASYNGEMFIAEQIESLLNQTIQDFKLYIHDDLSTDSTFSIIKEYARKYNEKVFAARNDKNSGGAKYNFIKMMIEHKDDYIMLCDHDDIWLPDKIEISLAAVKMMEAEYGTETPILVHTDLRIVNERLETIHPSYKISMNADFNKTALRNQIIQNTLAGCSAIYNRALSNLITSAPPYMVMHDWWLILLASAFGKISHVDRETALYRQHSKNEIGAKNTQKISYKLNRLFHGREVREAIALTYPQAQSLLDMYKHLLSEEQISLLTDYCSIPSRSKLQRIRTIFRLGTFKNGLSRNIAYLLYI